MQACTVLCPPHQVQGVFAEKGARFRGKRGLTNHPRTPGPSPPPPSPGGRWVTENPRGGGRSDRSIFNIWQGCWDLGQHTQKRQILGMVDYLCFRVCFSACLRFRPPFTGVPRGARAWKGPMECFLSKFGYPHRSAPKSVFWVFFGTLDLKVPKGTQKALFGALRGGHPKLLKKHCVGHFQPRTPGHSCKSRPESQAPALKKRRAWTFREAKKKQKGEKSFEEKAQRTLPYWKCSGACGGLLQQWCYAFHATMEWLAAIFPWKKIIFTSQPSP